MSKFLGILIFSILFKEYLDRKPQYSNSESILEKHRAKENLNGKLDTLSLFKFWHKFQRDLKSDNRDAVISHLNYPVHALFPVIFKFACDCDTASFVADEEKYSAVDIDSSNIKTYYSFLFSDCLGKVVSKTSVRELLARGLIYKDSSGLTYNFKPQNYGINTACDFDHVMMFHLSFVRGAWYISIGGL